MIFHLSNANISPTMLGVFKLHVYLRTVCEAVVVEDGLSPRCTETVPLLVLSLCTFIIFVHSQLWIKWFYQSVTKKGFTVDL